MSSSSSVGLRRLTCRKSRASGHLARKVVTHVTDHERARDLVPVPVDAEEVGRPGADFGVIGQLNRSVPIDPPVVVREHLPHVAGCVTQLDAPRAQESLEVGVENPGVIRLAQLPYRLEYLES